VAKCATLPLLTLPRMSELIPPAAIPTPEPARIVAALAAELSVRPAQVAATLALLDDGATVPFIARYRKEATGGLDDTVLRTLEVRLLYLRELEERRHAILLSIAEQGKLTPALHAELDRADTKQRLEDLYAPYKPKRRTRAQIARELGLEPLADAILADPRCVPAALAASYVNADVADARAALDGARDILAERFAENADVLSDLRAFLRQSGWLSAKVIEGKEDEGGNFRDWFDFSERLSTLPSHRVLALLRGRQQGILDLRVTLDEAAEALIPHPCVARIARGVQVDAAYGVDGNERQRWLGEVCRWTWRVKLAPAFETECITQLRTQAEDEAIRVFSANLKDLLLAAPAGAKAVMGLDPGIRTGVKVAVIDATGKLLEATTIYPFEPRRDVRGSLQSLMGLLARHQPALIAIGNGTASRETDMLVRELLQQCPNPKPIAVTVSEAGASVYSASELAAQEFPQLDVSLRGAVSIARRLQDPLAELVKIEPKAIGVGQYQHDVNQRALARSLDATVEDCVNAVGVDVNTASAPLLARISGLNQTLAHNIVAWRDANGPFPNRKTLLKVPRFGAKAFEQAAGFLRIPAGDNPLDACAVHPEAYPVVERILHHLNTDARAVMGQKLTGVSPAQFTDARFGLPTVRDIFAELEKPGRDPRPAFKTATFQEGINTLNDLHEGMILEGVVTNVANFGAFVDIGVHQDGLVHISALADKFVEDPRDVVRVGQTVKVKVQEVDVARKRIALTMRLNDQAAPARRPERGERGEGQTRRRPPPKQSAGAPGVPQGAMAAAFANLKR